MLTAPSKKILSFPYISDYGKLEFISGMLEYDINTQNNVSDTWDNLISDYQKINLIKGYSKYKTATQIELNVDEFIIKTNEMIRLNIPMMGYNGSIKEVISSSINHQMCQMMSTVGNDYSSSYVNLIQNYDLFVLVYGDKNGIRFKTGKLDFEYYEDRNDNCSSCINAFNRLQEVLTDISGKILFCKENINSDFYLTGDCIEVSLKIFNVQSLMNSIYTDLYGICHDAKVSKIIFNEV